jgi:hypothetical protein
VAPTQENVFKMAAGSSREWTEFWRPMGTMAAAEDSLYAANYSEALGAVDAWLESLDGVPQAVYDSIDAWLAEVALRPPTEVLHEGTPFGALEQERQEGEHQRRGSGGGGVSGAISASMPFTVGVGFAAEAKQWLELMRDGTFSAATLADPIPLSWQVSAGWRELVRASAAAHGTTWLHECHLGVMAAEEWRLVDARAHFNTSLALRPTPIVARNLAALAPVSAAEPDGNTTERWAMYQRAWALAVATHGERGELLQHHLAGEIGRFLVAARLYAPLQHFGTVGVAAALAVGDTVILHCH